MNLLKRNSEESAEGPRKIIKVEEEPTIIGAFSVDVDGNFKNDMRALKYLKIPKTINFNLKEVYDNIKDSIKENPHNYLARIKNVTQFIMENPKIALKGNRVYADFVCFRGVLRNILASFYDLKKFDVYAVKFDGTIYMAIVMNPIKRNKKDLEFIEYGAIFERFILSSNPNCYPPKDKTPDRSQFCVVMSRAFGDFNIIFGAECDGINSNEIIQHSKQLNISQLVEVKQRFNNPLSFSTKLDWWCQSYTAAIGKIHLGKRDPNGVITSMEEIDVESLANKELNKFWDKNVCLKRLNEFLKKIKDDMKDIDDPRKVFRFGWKGTCNDFSVEFTPIELPSGQTFLQEDYIEFINGQDKEPMDRC